uniref:Uncharacterized protein n=1 Tax=Manihot esculenta TaxID=3983 RepID=A0A2C9UGW0_MANES
MHSLIYIMHCLAFCNVAEAPIGERQRLVPMERFKFSFCIL